MALKRIHQSSNAGETPEEMFRDIKNRKVLGALPHQAAIWREYCKEEFIDTSDIALQLPTGSGKTLVGLGIAEWRRRRFKEKVVYLCSTTQLVNQVVEQWKLFQPIGGMITSLSLESMKHWASRNIGLWIMPHWVGDASLAIPNNPLSLSVNWWMGNTSCSNFEREIAFSHPPSPT